MGFNHKIKRADRYIEGKEVELIDEKEYIPLDNTIMSQVRAPTQPAGQRGQQAGQQAGQHQQLGYQQAGQACQTGQAGQ